MAWALLAPLTCVISRSGMTRHASLRGARNAVLALYEPVLELPCCDVDEPNLVIERSEERYAGADQDGNSSYG
jgi:hypothetical protein